MLLKNYQESQDIMSSRILPREIQIIKEIIRCQSGQEGLGSKLPRDPNCQDVKIAKGPRCQESNEVAFPKGLIMDVVQTG